MAELNTAYLGLELKNPLIVGASPLTKKVDLVNYLEDAGAAAVVMHSLFEEQIGQDCRALDYFLSQGAEAYSEQMTYYPDLGMYNIGGVDYPALIQKLKDRVDIPIIASLNGIGSGGWIKTARNIEEAGADALELNVFFLPTNREINGQELEKSYIEIPRLIFLPTFSPWKGDGCG